MKVLYFAWLKEKIGHGSEDVFPPGDVKTVKDLMVWLHGRDGAYGDAFGDMSVVRVAVNQDHVNMDHPVHDDDEVAFFPPVTGG